MAGGVLARIGRFFGFGSSSSKSSPVEKGAFEGIVPKRTYSGHRRFHDFRRDFLAEDGRTPATAETQEDQEEQENPVNQGTQEDENESGEIDDNIIEEKLKNINERMSPRRLQENFYDETDPAETQPMFETHASFQQDSPMGMHSFIGLRYTKKNARFKVKSRKRIVVGFGANGTTFGDAFGFNTKWASRGKNSLMDDSGHHSSAATQTKITKTQALNLLDAIPRFSSEFNYNVLGTNCNDFVRTMAKIVGASLPAQLHTAVTGPIGAKSNILSAGAGDEKTKIFYARQPKMPYPSTIQEFIPWFKGQIISAFDLDTDVFSMATDPGGTATTVKREFGTFIHLLEMLETHMKFVKNGNKPAENRMDALSVMDNICDILVLESQKLNIVGKVNCNELGIQAQAFLRSIKLSIRLMSNTL